MVQCKKIIIILQINTTGPVDRKQEENKIKITKFPHKVGNDTMQVFRTPTKRQFTIETGIVGKT